MLANKEKSAQALESKMFEELLLVPVPTEQTESMKRYYRYGVWYGTGYECGYRPQKTVNKKL